MLRIGDGVAWTAGPARVVAMDLSRPSADPFVLEASAAVVWEEIAHRGPIGSDDLLSSVAKAFDVDVEIIRDSVEALLAQLIARSLLIDDGNLDG